MAERCTEIVEAPDRPEAVLQWVTAFQKKRECFSQAAQPLVRNSFTSVNELNLFTLSSLREVLLVPARCMGQHQAESYCSKSGVPAAICKSCARSTASVPTSVSKSQHSSETRLARHLLWNGHIRVERSHLLRGGRSWHLGGDRSQRYSFCSDGTWGLAKAASTTCVVPRGPMSLPQSDHASSPCRVLSLKFMHVVMQDFPETERPSGFAVRGDFTSG